MIPKPTGYPHEMLCHFRGKTYKVVHINKKLGTPFTIVICAMLVMTAFVIGREWENFKSSHTIQHTNSTVFEFAPIYGNEPSDAATMAWNNLFPQQGGFFMDTDIAPSRSAFSVFHQLHCLKSIWEGYWVLHAQAVNMSQITDFELPIMLSPPHIAHCVDLLRQSLMCQPDLTVEVKNTTLGGVTGFGTTHQCKDWDELLDWMNQHQTNGTTYTENGPDT